MESWCFQRRYDFSGCPTWHSILFFALCAYGSVLSSCIPLIFLSSECACNTQVFKCPREAGGTNSCLLMTRAKENVAFPNVFWGFTKASFWCLPCCPIDFQDMVQTRWRCCPHSLGTVILGSQTKDRSHPRGKHEARLPYPSSVLGGHRMFCEQRARNKLNWDSECLTCSSKVPWEQDAHRTVAERKSSPGQKTTVMLKRDGEKPEVSYFHNWARRALSHSSVPTEIFVIKNIIELTNFWWDTIANFRFEDAGLVSVN